MHKPVLLEEVVKYILPQSGGIYIDATVGEGGHAERILAESSPQSRLIGIDRDPYMLRLAVQRLKGYQEQCIFVLNNFINLSQILSELQIGEVAGILFDLGVASQHFLNPDRGFSLLREGPLDMRLDPEQKLTAADIINKWRPEKIKEILYQYGEERRAKYIVNEIVAVRNQKPITTTIQLAEIITRVVCPRHKGKYKVPGYKIHPATKTFQALRIAVNNELENLTIGLTVAIDHLRSGGRLCVISFHSLEDRIVKNIFRSHSELKVITKKPLRPSRVEMTSNARARSAKLRVAEKV